MYYIDINSFEHKDNKERYETVIKICITDMLFERFIKLQLTESPCLINMYYNPLLKFLGLSPILISIDSTTKESASQINELFINQEIKFHFSNKNNRFLFEKKILHSLIKFMDRQLQQYENKYIVYGER